MVTGSNGTGKPTLLKISTGGLNPLDGIFVFLQRAIVGYFGQDLGWESDTLTPVQIVSNVYPKLMLKRIRRHLARYGVLSR